MAARKRRSTFKRKKAITRKHEQPPKQEVQPEVPLQPQISVVDNTPQDSAVSTTPLIESATLPPQTSVQQEPQPQPQPQPQSPQIQQPQPQPFQQATVVPNITQDTVVNPVQSGSNVGLVGIAPDNAPKNKHLFLIIGIVLICIAIIGGGLFYLRAKTAKEEAKKEQPAITPITPTSYISPSPSASKSAVFLDVSTYTIKVLNGSGIKGEASKVKDILEQEKFNIEDIGNADNANYEKSVISAKKEISSKFLDKLKAVLEETYVLDPNKELPDSEKVDVIVIIGSSKNP